MKVLCLLLPLMLGACSSMHHVTSMITPYRIDIRQGNYVSQAMAAKLKPGMTKDQVRFVLGTPMLTDMFHADRWDYVYYNDPRGGPIQERKFSVFFKDGKLVRVAGDVVAATPGAAEDAGQSAPQTQVIDIGAAPAAAKKPEAQSAGKQDKAGAPQPSK